MAHTADLGFVESRPHLPTRDYCCNTGRSASVSRTWHCRIDVGRSVRFGPLHIERPSVLGQPTGRFLYARAVAGTTGRLGRIANVTRKDAAALSREVPLDIAAIQAAWPAFESGFDSLHGRRMMGLIDNRAGTYRLCTERLPRDMESSLGLDETTIPGGRYLRLRLIGDPPGVYGQIAAAFDELFEHADHDPTRPLIEFYRREGEVDCLVPVTAAVPVA